MIKGIDISKYQGKPSFDLLKLQIDFIILKATEGNGYIDPEFKRNQVQARGVNLGLGYYHFARPDLGNSPELEANWFLQTIGELKKGEVLVLDFEVNFADPVNWCRKWLDIVFIKTGTRPLIYLNQSQTTSFNWRQVIDAGYGLWLAKYDNDPNNLNTTTSWPVVAMKQYTSSGKINGISGNVDVNTFFGDLNSFKLYGFNIQSPTPPPTNPVLPITNDQTKIDLGQDDGVQELGAIKSIIKDLKRDLRECREQPLQEPQFNNPIARQLYAFAKQLG